MLFNENSTTNIVLVLYYISLPFRSLLNVIEIILSKRSKIRCARNWNL